MNIIEKAHILRAIIENMAKGLDNEEALNAPELFPNWNGDGISYYTGDRVRYNGMLYNVLQNHTSQDDWTPTDAVSLFSKVLIPDTSTVPEWEQPDSTNPYMQGDHVMFNGVEYESLINNNIWSPLDYPSGWSAV